MPIQIQYRRGVAADWTSFNPTLALGEPGYETDTGKFKVGNGSTAWNSLAYASGTQGPQGSQGAQGPQGTNGTIGGPGIEVDNTAPVDTSILWADTGDPGDMVLPLGGSTGQALVKVSGSDYDTAWSTVSSPTDDDQNILAVQVFR